MLCKSSRPLILALGLLTAFTPVILSSCQRPEIADPKTSISGRFHIWNTKGSNIYPDSFWTVQASFYGTPGGNDPVLIQSLSFNGENVPLGFAPYGQSSSSYSGFSYTESDSLWKDGTWDVQGTNGIPSFKAVQHGPHPFYVNATPDTIDRSKGLTLTVNGNTTLNADSVSLSVSPCYCLGGEIKVVPVTDGDIHFSPSELTQFGDTGACYISISVRSSSVQYFIGKYFEFTRESNYTRPVFIR